MANLSHFEETPNLLELVEAHCKNGFPSDLADLSFCADEAQDFTISVCADEAVDN